ncbi:hypothetical protein BDM02DRAFT_3127417 [Thelephora ganbajun]|uniref:Uncharacterized protein n=1 Tax=Thelephora ganbajun TaxID=370292 RepID=A0ACB6ZM65_THEGA|nr:hypothetical protein BDM02DRAFT_3127417 [Thelephora ganbajun]
MHQCLHVEEIFHLVVEETVNLGYPSAISLACTCLTFEAAVMEVLWGSHQTDLVDLLRCFPIEVWEIRESDSGKLHFDFRRSPLPSEWKRVNRYASWMRNLNIYEDWAGPTLSPKAWQDLSAISPVHLLPNLQSLEWYSAPDTFIYINLFRSPRLTSLNVRVIPNTPNLVPILGSLPIETLEELRFLDLSGDRAVQDAISNLVLRTTATLRSIEVSSDLSDAAIRHVIRLPNLSDASVTFANLDRPAASRDAIFPSLRTLETRLDDKGGWKYFMEDTMNLESIVLHSLAVLQPEEVVTAFGFLINKGFHRTMHRLSFAVFEPCDLTPPVLAPLLNFGSLTRLSVTSPCDPTQCKSRLTNGALARLAEALPHLVELFLGDAPCASPARGITLAGLRPLSDHCTHLKTLQVHFSAHDVRLDIPDDALSNPSDQPPLGPNHCHLFQLVVGRLPISTSGKSPLIVAYFLHQMFPRLSKILWVDRNSPWKQVQEHVDMFQKYRPKK